MPSIIQRGDRFLCRVRKQGFPTVAKTFIKRADAKAWGLQTEADMQAGRWIADDDLSTLTLKEAIAEYKLQAAEKFKGSKSYDFVLDDLAAQPIGRKFIRDLTPGDFARWRDDLLARGLQPATVVRRLTLAAGLMTWLQKDRDALPTNPLKSVRRPRVDNARERVLTDQEVRFLLLGAQAKDHRASWLPDALIVLLRSAMRRGELHALTVQQIDFTKGVAVLLPGQTKNGRGRAVPLCREALAALERLAVQATARKEHLKPREAAEVCRPGEERLLPVAHANGITLAYMRALERAKHLYQEDCKNQGVEANPDFLKDARLHDLRHTAITEWAATGELSIHELLLISGHRDTAMLSRYVNIQASDLAQKLIGITTSRMNHAQ